MHFLHERPPALFFSNRSRVQRSEVQDRYDYVGPTRATIGGFIKY